MPNDIETAIKDTADLAEELRESSLDDGERLDRLKAALRDLCLRILEEIFPPYPQPVEETKPEHTDTEPCEPA